MQYIAFLVTIMLVLAICNTGGYWRALPTATMLYPESTTEAYDVELALKDLTPAELAVFTRSNATVAPVFAAIIPASEKEIEVVANRYDGIILLLKYIINRPRPAQRNTYVEQHKIPSSTVHTPAFPSGHSTQAFVVARHYSRIYPHLESRLHGLADAIGTSRVRAGHHYPSDHVAGEYLARLLGT